LDITNIGIGSIHRIVSTNQNTKVIVAIDDVIQTPIVSTAITTTLASNVFTTDDTLYFTGITSFFSGDLIKIENEIIKIESVGIGSTNAITVFRRWLNTKIAGYPAGTLVTKIAGDYNIIDNIINFAYAPIPGLKFQGRSFIRSGITDSAEETYSKNYAFNDISSEFNGVTQQFTLKSNNSNVSGIENKNAIILINDVIQLPGLPGLPGDYTLSELNEITSITFAESLTSTDKFSGWSIGELQVLDKLDEKFDGKSFSFQLTILDNLISIRSFKGSNVNVENTILVFINDILQEPGVDYIFKGGSIIRFTEPPEIGDTSKILFYKGSGSIDVVDVNIFETVKIGDELTIGYDPSVGQSPTLQEEERTVISVDSTDFVKTNPYFGSGNTEDENLERPITWCKQTEDKIINEQEVAKDRILYEAIINSTSYLIHPVGVGSTVIYVDNVRPFFNQTNESNISLEFQNKVTFIPQEPKVGASATAIVSSAGIVTSIQISNGGIGYNFNPSVVIQNSVGIGTTLAVNATANSTISSGTVSVINIINSGFGYTSTNPPIILIESPSFETEIDKVSSYEGDFGHIVGISTGSVVGVASTAIIFDFYIPDNSFLRDSSITGVTTISGIQTGYYFVVHNSNVGDKTTALDFNGSIVGVGTTFIDNIYQASSVSIAQTSVIGVGITYVTRVVSSLQNHNGLIGISSSNFFGEYSWGRVSLISRSKNISYNSYTLNGVSGLTTGTILKRTNPLMFSDYIS
jgi:hypothetical protein